jgi:hypothetical protein
MDMRQDRIKGSTLVKYSKTFQSMPGIESSCETLQKYSPGVCRDTPIKSGFDTEILVNFIEASHASPKTWVSVRSSQFPARGDGPESVPGRSVSSTMMYQANEIFARARKFGSGLQLQSSVARDQTDYSA